MATNEKFYSDLNVGRKSELEVMELCNRQGFMVEDASRLKTCYDLVVNCDTYLEVKNQKSIVESNEIVIELTNQYNDFGWFFKDGKCTDYCFHRNGTNRYIFLSRDALHCYYTVRSNKCRQGKCGGCEIAYIDINDLSEYCKDRCFPFNDYIDD